MTGEQFLKEKGVTQSMLARKMGSRRQMENSEILRTFFSERRKCPKEQINITIKEVVEKHHFWGEKCYVVDVEQLGEVTERTIPQWIIDLTIKLIECGEIR